MKRKAVVAALMLALVMLFTQLSFAEGEDGVILITTAAPQQTTASAGTLEITNIVPTDGEKGKQISNMAVKIAFSEDITDTANDLKNGKCITITAEDGTVVNFSVAHHEKYPDELWLIVEGDLVTNTVYTVEISAGIVADSGNTLASGTTTTFQTRNTKTDSSISVIMMIGMVVIMVMTTSKATKKAAEEKAADKKPESAVAANPYKLAKEQGISLDEAKAQIAKEKEKEAKKNKSAVKAHDKKVESDAEFEAAVAKRAEEIYKRNVKHVHAACGVKAHGRKVPKIVDQKIQKYVKRANKK